MANTPRSSSAYILLGAMEQSGRVIRTPGITEHPDESELGRTVASRVRPTPRFSYRQVEYDGLEFGLIEIPSDQPGIIVPRADFEVLRQNVVYIRRNTQNIEADPDDLARIFRSPQGSPSSDPDLNTGSWEQLYRACDAFDSRRVHIAIIGRMPDADARDWSALSNVPWNVIVDFDTGTDSNGNYALARDLLGHRRRFKVNSPRRLSGGHPKIDCVGGCGRFRFPANYPAFKELEGMEQNQSPSIGEDSG